MCASTSPQGTYTVNMYVVSAALSSDSIRGEVVTNKTGRKKNIYYEGEKYIPEPVRPGCPVVWESDSVAVINGERLDVRKDKYDYGRR